MKKTKVEARFEYIGLGFPVILLNVPMTEVRGMGLQVLTTIFCKKWCYMHWQIRHLH